MFKNILLATDGSPHAVRATEAAVELAHRFQARLTIVTVLPSSISLVAAAGRPQAAYPAGGEDAENSAYMDPLVSPRAVPDMPPPVRVPAQDTGAAEIADQILIQAVASAQRKGIAEINSLAVTGHPAEAIVKCAKETSSDMIVMGTRGLSDLKGIIVGSISHKVLHLTDCPCLCVH